MITTLEPEKPIEQFVYPIQKNDPLEKNFPELLKDIDMFIMKMSTNTDKSLLEKKIKDIKQVIKEYKTKDEKIEDKIESEEKLCWLGKNQIFNGFLDAFAGAIDIAGLSYVRFGVEEISRDVVYGINIGQKFAERSKYILERFFESRDSKFSTLSTTIKSQIEALRVKKKIIKKFYKLIEKSIVQKENASKQAVDQSIKYNPIENEFSQLENEIGEFINKISIATKKKTFETKVDEIKNNILNYKLRDEEIETKIKDSENWFFGFRKNHIFTASLDVLGGLFEIGVLSYVRFGSEEISLNMCYILNVLLACTDKTKYIAERYFSSSESSLDRLSLKVKGQVEKLTEYKKVIKKLSQMVDESIEHKDKVYKRANKILDLYEKLPEKVKNDEGRSEIVSIAISRLPSSDNLKTNVDSLSENQPTILKEPYIDESKDKGQGQSGQEQSQTGETANTSVKVKGEMVDKTLLKDDIKKNTLSKFNLKNRMIPFIKTEKGTIWFTDIPQVKIEK